MKKFAECVKNLKARFAAALQRKDKPVCAKPPQPLAPAP